MKTYIFAAIALSVASFTVHADELILTANSMTKSKVSQQQFAIDFVTEGNAVAFQFNITLPKGVDASKVDLSSCVADLPKTHAGQCNVAKGQIIGMVYNETTTAFPAGVVPVGKIRINGMTKHARAGGVQIAQFLVSDSNAKPIDATFKIAE